MRFLHTAKNRIIFPLNKDAYRALLFDTSESIFKPHAVGRDWWRLQFYFSPVPSCQHLYLNAVRVWNTSSTPLPRFFSIRLSRTGFCFQSNGGLRTRKEHPSESFFRRIFLQKIFFPTSCLESRGATQHLAFFRLQNRFFPHFTRILPIDCHKIPW